MVAIVMNEPGELFEEVLAFCLDRLADGDAPEACAADFPEYPDLLLLLEIAAELRAQPQPQPGAAWLRASRERLEARIRRQSPN